MRLVAVHDLVECIETSWKSPCPYFGKDDADIRDLRKNIVPCMLCVCGNQKGRGIPIPIMSPDPELTRAQNYFGLPSVPGMFDQTAGEDCS